MLPIIKCIIGCTAKSVTELLNFSCTIYGVGFLQIPTNSYSDVTFSCKHKDVVTKTVVHVVDNGGKCGSVTSFSSSGSTSLESVPSTSNVPVNHLAVSDR